MSLDVLHEILITKDGAQAPLGGGGMHVYLDSYGFCTYVGYAYELITLDGYRIARGDISEALRLFKNAVAAEHTGQNTQLYGFSVALDLSKDDTAVIEIRCQVGNSYPYQYVHRIFELEPRTGWIRAVNGSPVEYTQQEISLSGSDDMLIGVDAEYYYFSCYRHATSSSSSGIYLICRLPRDTAKAQVLEQVFGSKNAHMNYLCKAKTTGSFWLSGPDITYGESANLPTSVWMKNVSSSDWSILYETRLLDTRLSAYRPKAGWYSRKLDIFVFLGDNTVYVCAPTPAPVTVLPPEIYDPNQLTLKSISNTNPAEITCDSNLTLWMEQHQLGDGDSVYIPYVEGYNNLRITDRNGNEYYKVASPDALTGRSLPITRLSTSVLSVDIDGAEVVDDQQIDGFYEGSLYYRPGTVCFYGVLGSWRIGDKVVVVAADSNFTSLVGTVMEVEYVIDGGSMAFLTVPGFTGPYSVGSNFIFDVLVVRRVPANGVFPLRGVVAATDKDTVRISKARLSAPIVFEVDSPGYFDKLGLEDGQTAAATIYSSFIFGSPPDYMTKPITRLSATTFSVALDGSLYAKEYTATRVTSSSNAVIRIGAWFPGYPFYVGSKFKLVGSDTLGALTGTIFTVTSITYDTGSQDYFLTTDMNTSAYTEAAWATIALYEFSEPLFDSRLQIGVAKEGAGVPLRTRVLGDLSEPCVGFPVRWTTTGGGEFSSKPSISDAEGYAVTVFYPDVAVDASYTLTAEVDWI